MRRPGQRGLGLMELLVVFVLLGLLMTTSLDFLLSLFRDSGRASLRHGLQTTGLRLSEELAKTLRHTGEPGLTLHDDGDWTGFSATSLETVTTTSQQVWSEEAALFYWIKAQRRMLTRTCPPLPPGLTLAFAPDRPPRPEPDQFRTLFAVDGGRLLCDKVTLFEISKNEGLVTFRLELRDEGSHGASDRFSIQRELSLKS